MSRAPWLDRDSCLTHSVTLLGTCVADVCDGYLQRRGARVMGEVMEGIAVNQLDGVTDCATSQTAAYRARSAVVGILGLAKGTRG